MHVVAVRGDLTKQRVDAIVNAADPALLGGGGVDGAIHAAAGPSLLAACRRLAADALGVRCPTGEARITKGFDLPAKYVIHTVGPIYRSHSNPAGALAGALRACLDLATVHGLRTIAFPAISCGAYGYPEAEAARVLVGVAREGWDVDEIRFVLFKPQTAAIFDQAIRSAASS